VVSKGLGAGLATIAQGILEVLATPLASSGLRNPLGLLAARLTGLGPLHFWSMICSGTSRASSLWPHSDPVGHAGWIQGSVRLARPNRWRSIGLLYSWHGFLAF
jgi:hypothetical protein